MPDNDALEPMASDAEDDALRRQLNEQVLQLAEYDKRKYDNDLWEQELKKEQQKRATREKEEAEMRRRSGAPSAFTEAVTDILASVLAYLTWIIAGAVVLFAVGGGFWLWRNINAVDELKQPLAYNVGDGKGDVDAETLKIAEKEAGKAAAKGGRPLTPDEQAKLEAAAKAAAQQAASSGKKDEQGSDDEGSTPEGNEKADGKNNAPKADDKTPASKNMNPQKAGKQSTHSQKTSGQKKGTAAKKAQQPNKQQQNKQQPQSQQLPQPKNANAKTPPRSQPKPSAKTPTSEKKPRLAALPPSLRNNNPRQNAKPQTQPTPLSAHRVAHSRQLMLQLKQLWNQGKTAKHRGDYASAKRAWQQALKLCPGHPGFAPSIQKLPTKS